MKYEVIVEETRYGPMFTVSYKSPKRKISMSIGGGVTMVQAFKLLKSQVELQEKG